MGIANIAAGERPVWGELQPTSKPGYQGANERTPSGASTHPPASLSIHPDPTQIPYAKCEAGLKSPPYPRFDRHPPAAGLADAG